MSQPIWKLLWSTDTHALYTDESSEYDPELAILDEYETRRGTTRFYVYRVSLEGFKRANDTIVNEFGNEPWFAGDLAAVASTVDTTREDLLAALCSDEPSARAGAYQDIIGHFGTDEFDQYPLDLTESEVKNWPDLDGKPEIVISVSGDDDGMVVLYCSDKEAARDDQSVLGSHWEMPGDMTDAYACVSDRTDLVTALEADGWDVDASEWSAPDAQDFAFWSAKYERDNGASPERLREILGWVTLADVAATRRVQDADSPRDPESPLDYLVTEEYHKACFAAGFVIDFEQWLDEKAEQFEREREVFTWNIADDLK